MHVAVCLLRVACHVPGPDRVLSYLDNDEIFTSGLSSNISVAYRSPPQLTFTPMKGSFVPYLSHDSSPKLLHVNKQSNNSPLIGFYREVDLYKTVIKYDSYAMCTIVSWLQIHLHSFGRVRICAPEVAF
jgi:hypothetical protein